MSRQQTDIGVTRPDGVAPDGTPLHDQLADGDTALVSAGARRALRGRFIRLPGEFGPIVGPNPAHCPCLAPCLSSYPGLRWAARGAWRVGGHSILWSESHRSFDLGSRGRCRVRGGYWPIGPSGCGTPWIPSLLGYTALGCTSAFLCRFWRTPYCCWVSDRLTLAFAGVRGNR